MRNRHSFAKKSKLTFWGVSAGYLFIQTDKNPGVVLENIAFADGTTRTGRFMSFIREKSYWDTKKRRDELPFFKYGDKHIQPSHGAYKRQDLNDWWFNNSHLFE